MVCNTFLIKIVTTKNVPELVPVSSMIAPLLQGDPLVVLMQNGVGIEQELQSVYPNLKIASCVLYLAVTQPVPGMNATDLNASREDYIW